MTALAANDARHAAAAVGVERQMRAAPERDGQGPRH